MNPIFAGMAVQAVGGVMGGKSRTKLAKRYRREAQAAAENYKGALVADQDRLAAMNIADQERAIAYRADDEARLKAATGYDLAKLRDDAVKAGFNPLTVLNATGAAGYEGRGAVLTTPFIGREFIGSADGDRAYFDANMGSQSAVNTAGYVGDAVAGLGSGIVDYGTLRMQQRHEAAMLEASLRGNTSAPGAIRGTRVAGGRRGGTAPLVGAVTVAGAPGDSVTYPGMGTQMNPEGTFPMTAKMRDPLFNDDWVMGNPDIDNEWLNGAMLATLPAQAWVKSLWGQLAQKAAKSVMRMERPNLDGYTPWAAQ